MATDLQTRKTSSKPDAYLQGKFADLCARIQRVDLLAHLLAVSLTVLGYAMCIAVFDWFAGNSTAISTQATRTISYLVFLGLVGFFLVQTVRCGLRRVNPYFIAHQLEQTLPDSKNSLINWLDMHDEAMPSAFQKNLSAVAAEQLQECDAEQTVKKRKHWILLGVHAVPALGLLVLLILGPSAFASSMLRAFLPFYTPPPVTRTQITLVQPEAGDAEVSPTQAIAFVARIDGGVPIGNRPDAPKLSYRYQANEDYLTQPLQQDDGGAWTAQLHAAQIRTGFSYKISAGDAETPEYQVRVRARAHVKKFEVTYRHRPYRNLPIRTIAFPNQQATRPIVQGPRGSEVELVVRASRPVKKANVEIVTKTGKKDLPTRKLSDDSFASTWPLDQPGQFRVTFTSVDGEENSDRDWYPIDVREDDAPRVVLTKPGKDVQLPVNGTLELEGEATSLVGVRSVTLHMRVVAGTPKLPTKVYRPEMLLQFDNGTYPHELPVMYVAPLDQLKDDKGTIQLLRAGTMVEYWLEATDCADYPNPAGNIGKSPVYKITLTPAPIHSKQEQAKRDAARNRQKEHEKKQDGDLAQQNKNPTQNPGSEPGPEDPQRKLLDAKKEKDETEQKIKKELEEKEKNQERGGAKSAEQTTSAAKEGPQDSADGPKPGTKDQPPMPPEDAGNKKEQGDGSTGESKDNGEKKKKEGAPKGERKDGPKGSAGAAKDGGPMPKQEPAGGAKDAGPMGMNTPMPQPAKEPSADDGAPMPTTKQDAKSDQPTQGSAKGVDQNGPETPNKNAQAGVNPTQPPNTQAKGGTMNDAAGESKQGPPDPAKQPGNARADEPKVNPKEPSWDQIAKKIEQLPNHDAAAEKAGKDLADIGQNSEDPRKSEIVKEALQKNGRDPNTGKEVTKKGPNPFASGGGKSPGISDEVKIAAANRDFAARIGQMQLDDWKKRVTPDLLEKAGLSEAEWQRYLKNRPAYDALVRQLNAKLFKDAVRKELRGSVNPGAGIREVGSATTSNDSLGAGRGRTPPELRDAVRRFSEPRANP
jgi:hypothetical protein